MKIGIVVRKARSLSEMRAVAEKRHYCKACDLACRFAYDLEVHRKTKNHLKKVTQMDAVDSGQIEDFDVVSMLDQILIEKYFVNCSNIFTDPQCVLTALLERSGCTPKSTSENTFTVCSLLECSGNMAPLSPQSVLTARLQGSESTASLSSQSALH